MPHVHALALNSVHQYVVYLLRAFATKLNCRGRGLINFLIRLTFLTDGLLNDTLNVYVQSRKFTYVSKYNSWRGKKKDL